MNLSPSIPDPRSHTGESRRLDIVRTLSPLARAMGLGRVARGALRGFALGTAAGTCVLLAGHIPGAPWKGSAFVVPAALVAAALGTLAGAALGLARWPRPLEAARAADLYFGLDDRLTTALELRSSNTPVAALQSLDVARQIDGLALTRSRGGWLRRGEAGLAALAVLAFAGALALGPQHRGHRGSAAASSEAVRGRRAAAAQVKKLASTVHLGLTPTQQQSPAMRKLDLALARLRRQLLHATTPRSALRAISATQQQLRQLAHGLHPVNSRAVAQLNSSLSKAGSKGQTGKGQASKKTGPSARSALATAQALNRLAQSLAHLTPAQRAALARALAQSANATSDSSLRAALRQAASALANGDPQSARAALQQAAQSLAQAAGQQAALSRLGAAGSQLDSLKNQLSGASGQSSSGTQPGQSGQLATGSNAQGTGQQSGSSQGTGTRSGQAQGAAGAQGSRSGLGQGNRPGQGQGNRPGQGRGNGLGRGTQAGRGNGTGRGARGGRGNGRGVGTAQGTGNRPGQGIAGGHGNGGQGRSAATRSGRYVTVYVPGKQGKGSETILNGSNGAPQPGSLIPYQQVFGRYTQSARQALDRASLPPSLQGYVRRYFSTISH